MEPKCGNFRDPFGQSGSVLEIDLGVCVIIYIINCVLMSRRPEMGMENRFPKVEQMFDEWAAHGQPTCSVLETVKTISGLW